MEFGNYMEKDKFVKRINELKEILGSKPVLFYGAGILFEYLIENQDMTVFNIIGISDRKFKNEEFGSKFLNYNVVPIDFIDKSEPEYVVISVLEWKKVIESLKNSIKNPNIKIIPLFEECNEKYKSLNYVTKTLKPKGFEVLKFDADTEEVIFSNGNLNIYTDVQYPWIVGEIFAEDIYKFQTNLDLTKQYSVLDIGANRCYASIYFAQKDWVKDVYAFELVPQTVEIAQKNLELNPKYSSKIKLYPFGLGKENTTVTIEMLPHRDGCNTIENNFFDNYMPQEHGKGIPQVCEIKKTSEVISKIVEENSLDNIIFKIDAEGAEYDIIEDLSENYPQIFDKIAILVGDTHLGFERFYDFLPKDKFKIVYANKQENGCCPFEIVKL